MVIALQYCAQYVLANISEQQTLGVSLQRPLGESLTSIGPGFSSLLPAWTGQGLVVEHRDGGHSAGPRVGGPRGRGVIRPLIIWGVARVTGVTRASVQRGQSSVQVTRGHWRAQGQARY